VGVHPGEGAYDGRVSGPPLRDVLHRYPHGVAVVTVETPDQRLGLTIASLVSLSLDPPLVGFTVSGQAALHEILVDAKRCAISLLAEGQDDIAEHFARGVPPIAHWHGIELEERSEGPPLISGAIGWIDAETAWTATTGTHTLFVGSVTSALRGHTERALIRVRGGWDSA
jgi:flavin reductase